MSLTKLAPAASTSATALAFQREDPTAQPDWDARLKQLAQPGIFHSAAWAAVLQDTYGFRPVYFTARRGNELEGVLPLMEVNSWLTGIRGVSLPFSDYCQVLGSSEGILQALFQEALKHGRLRKWKYLEVRGGAGIRGLLNDGSFSLSFYGHKLNLARDADQIFAGLDGKTRNQVRQAQKSGLVTETSQELDAVRRYYALHCRTRQKHGLPPQPFRFFAKIHEHILSKNLGAVVSAKFKNQTVASGIYFSDGVESVHKFGASDMAFQKLRANNLVMWEAIKWCVGRGNKVLEFGRTSPDNEGLRRYKLGWGTEEYPIHYFRCDLASNRIISLKDETVGWYNRVFGILPKFITRMVGAAVYKHIA
jgi:hypothetical protein